MKEKKAIRVRRALKTRRRQAVLQAQRLCVHRTPRHIYAQIIDATGGRVLAAASTLEADVRKALADSGKCSGNVTAAGLVGTRIAEKAKAAGVSKVAFDRSGFKYHGRVKALADAARAGGLEF